MGKSIGGQIIDYVPFKHDSQVLLKDLQDFFF